MTLPTRWIWNTCLAIWAAMALRLSPRVAAMNASACSAPARRSVSWSVPSPRVLRPREPAGRAPEGHREDDGVCLALRRLVDDGVAGVARLQEVALYLEVLAPRRHLCLREDLLPPLRLPRQPR